LGIFDVPATPLIKAMAKEFEGKLKQPGFTGYVKTGAHRERAPENRAWWFERTASILYRVYKDGPVGTESLRTYYGGKRNRGVRPHHRVKASGKIIRTCLQALEKEGLIKKSKKGRAITAQGQKLLAAKSRVVGEELKKARPAERAEEKEKVMSKEEVEVKDALKKQRDSEESKKKAEKEAKQDKDRKAKPEEAKGD